MIPRDAAVELEVGIQLLDFGRRHGGELPIVEDAVLVELLDDLRADARQLGEIVGRAAPWPREMPSIAARAMRSQ